MPSAALTLPGHTTTGRGLRLVELAAYDASVQALLTALGDDDQGTTDHAHGEERLAA